MCDSSRSLLTINSEFVYQTNSVNHSARVTESTKFCVKSESATMDPKAGSVTQVESVSVSTQCGDPQTVDEENIVVMVKSYSPVRDIEDEEIKTEALLLAESNDAGMESLICGGEKDKGKLTGTEKRKADDGEPNKDLKKAKLETKALKAKRPGFTDDRYNETSYYIENGKYENRC
jgi:hypothetical protein